MAKIKAEKPRITIVVSGGMVQDVYTTLTEDIEVDVLDYENASAESYEAVAEYDEYLETVRLEHHHIY